MKFRAALLALVAITSPIISTPAQSATLSIGVVYDIGGRGDRSYNDAAAAGLALAQQKIGFTVDAVVTDGTSADRDKRVRSLISKGCNPIVVIGSGFGPTLQTIAIEFPNISFAILNDASVPALNVNSLIFNQKQGAFIAGYAAALSTKTNKVAMIATAAQADIYQDGFLAGVLASKKAVASQVKYVSGSSSTVTKQLMGAGVDVIFVGRPGSNNDIFSAIVARNVANEKVKNYKTVGMISIEPDQYITVTSATKKYLLASIVNRVDIAMFDFITHASTGTTTLDILDPIAGIYGHRYNLSSGVELRSYSATLKSSSKALSQAALAAQKLSH